MRSSTTISGRLDTTTWQRVAELFDKVAPLPSNQRALILDDLAIDATARDWLERLLATHDSNDPALIDRAVDEIIAELDGATLPDQAWIKSTIVGRMFGPWRALEEIGRGGMGVVLLAERADGQYEKRVALKLVSTRRLGVERSDALRSEVRLLARLDHPDIARLLDGGITDDDVAYLVMELVNGIPIDRYCSEQAVSLRDRVALMARVVRAISHSHRQLVVHRDIKPSNILVTGDGNVKIVDFGIGAQLHANPGDGGSALPWPRCTPGYASPEQLAGRAPAIPDDIFALGAVLFEVASGRRLRDAASTTRLLICLDRPGPGRRSLNEAIPERIAGDVDLTAICAKAVSPDPGQRYDDAHSLANDLENWLNDQPVAARNGGPVYRAGKWIRRYRWLTALATTAALSLLIGSGVALWQSAQAIKASEQAEREAARSVAALARSEESLRQARAVSTLLQDLFRATTPDRPREEFPDTGEILTRGAHRAMVDAGLGPSERIELLLTIAHVYLTHNRPEAADPLIDTALALARERRATHPAELAKALYAKAVRHQDDDTPEIGKRRLVEIKDVLGDPDTDWDTYVLSQTSLAYRLHSGLDLEGARSILVPMYERIQGRADISSRTRLNLLQKLLGLYKDMGELDLAVATGREVGVLLADTEGASSVVVAHHHNAMSLLEFNRGRYRESTAYARQAIALYDRILDKPYAYRGFARRIFGYSQLQLGEFESGRLALQSGHEEAALVANVGFDHSASYWTDMGWFFGRFVDDPDRAEDALRRVRALVSTDSNAPLGAVEMSELILSTILCRSGRSTEGRSILADMEAQLGTDLSQLPFQLRAELHDARAYCHYQAGELPEALAEIDNALAASAGNGRAVERAAILTLKAKVLHDLGDHQASGVALDAANGTFLDRGLDQHPHLDNIAKMRQQLFRQP